MRASVFALVLKEDLPIRQAGPCVAAPRDAGRNCSQVWSGPPGFRAHCRQRRELPRPAPGLFDREVWGICRTSLKPEQPLQALTGVVLADTSLAPENLSLYAPAPGGAEWDVVRIHNTLKHPGAGSSRLSLSWIQWSRPPPLVLTCPGEIGRWGPLREAVNACAGAGPDSMPGWKPFGAHRRFGAVDYAQVNELVDPVVLSGAPGGQPGHL